jgi:hypothetical protein
MVEILELLTDQLLVTQTEIWKARKSEIGLKSAMFNNWLT